MPTIFDEHNVVHAMKRIAAAKDENDFNIDDLQAVHELLGRHLAKARKRVSVANVRAAKIDRAIADPAMKPVIDQVNGSLKRLGITLSAAADLTTLNKAMADHRWNENERLRLKAMLHTVGVLA
jgi:hypothetical protein